MGLLLKVLELFRRLQERYPHIGYAYMAMSTLSLVCMQLFLREASKWFTPFYLLCLRAVLLLIINGFLLRELYPTAEIHIWDPSTWKIIVKRLFLSTLTVSLYLVPSTYISLSTVNALFNLNPVFICLFEAWFYSKKLQHRQLALVCLSFLGVLLITRPQFLFGEAASVHTTFESVMILLVIISAITNSFSMIYLHELRNRINNLEALMYFYIPQVFFNGLLCFTDENISRRPVQSWLSFSVLAFFFALSAFGAQVLVGRAMFLQKPSYNAPFNYISIVLSFIIDVGFSHEDFDGFSVLGIFLTGSGLFIQYIQRDELNSESKTNNEPMDTANDSSQLTKAAK